MKTSISLDENTLKAVDDFRRTRERIPTLSKAILDLIHRGLEEKKEILKEPYTEIPKEAITFKALTLHMRDRRGGSSTLNLPYKTALEHGLQDLDKVDAWIRKIQGT